MGLEEATPIACAIKSQPASLPVLAFYTMRQEVCLQPLCSSRTREPFPRGVLSQPHSHRSPLSLERVVGRQTLAPRTWVFGRHFLIHEQREPVVSRKKKLRTFVAKDKFELSGEN